MKLSRIASVATLAFALAAPFAAQADTSRQLEDAIAKICEAEAGMVSKKKFMEAVGKRFDAMDKGGKGMVSVKDAARLVGGDLKIWTPAF